MLRKRQIPYFYRKLDEEHLFVLLRFGDVSRQIRILRRFEVRSPPIGDSVQHLAKKGERVSRAYLTILNWLSGRDKIGSLTAPSSWSGRRYDLTSQWADVWVPGLDLLPASLHHQATWKRCFLKAMKDCQYEKYLFTSWDFCRTRRCLTLIIFKLLKSFLEGHRDKRIQTKCETD